MYIQGKKTLAAPIPTRHAYFCHGRTLDLEKNTIKTAHDTSENTYVFPLTLSKFLGSLLQGPLRHIKHNRKGFYNCIAASIDEIIKRGGANSIMLYNIQVRSTGQPPQGHAELQRVRPRKTPWLPCTHVSLPLPFVPPPLLAPLPVPSSYPSLPRGCSSQQLQGRRLFSVFHPRHCPLSQTLREGPKKS